MGQGKQYAVLDPKKGALSAVVLGVAMLASVAILGAAVIIAIKLASVAQEEKAPSPPAPPPPRPLWSTPTTPLQMALAFMKTQKSGKLPPDNPVSWRGNSGLLDGQDQNRNLSGGFYVGGENIKYNFPMAFSITMLSWAVLEYNNLLDPQDFEDAKEIIMWGADYFVRSRYENLVFPQVGVPEIDDVCWVRPENMRPEQRPTPYPCDVTHPCSDLAAEMAAALAAASMVFKKDNAVLSGTFLQAAIGLFEYADGYKGRYSDWVSEAKNEYPSSGYYDDLMWGASWLYYASGDDKYLHYVIRPYPERHVYLWNISITLEPFSWDVKNAGVQVLMARIGLLGYGLDPKAFPDMGNIQNYLGSAINYVCQYTKNYDKSNFTSGGLVWTGRTNKVVKDPIELMLNTKFLTLLMADYWAVAYANNFNSNYKAKNTEYFYCAESFSSITQDVVNQVNYVLGKNPLNMSYLIGWGKSPTHSYHRAASIPSFLVDSTNYTCDDGMQWRDTTAPNPNPLIGGIAGGPDINDNFEDTRLNPNNEPKLHRSAVFAGVLAGLQAFRRPGNDIPGMFMNLPKLRKQAIRFSKRVPKPKVFPRIPSPPVSPPPYTNPPPPPPPSPPAPSPPYVPPPSPE